MRYDTLPGDGADDGDHFTNEAPPRPLKVGAGIKRITANIMLGLSNVTFGMSFIMKILNQKSEQRFNSLYVWYVVEMWKISNQYP